MALIMAMRRLLHVVSPLSLSSCSGSCSSSSRAAALAATRTPLHSKLCWQQPFLVATTKGQEVCASAGFFTESSASSSSPAVFLGGCSGVLEAKDSRVSGASFNKGERRRRRRGAEKRGFGNYSSSSSSSSLSSSVMGLGVQQERAVAVEGAMDPVQKRLMFEDE